jgi:hypothetical protein
MSYWETRYKLGGTSGPGSIGKLQKWKWSVIEKYVQEIVSVIDVGCGDLSFWKGRPIPLSYYGIDISKTIVERNSETYGPRFICSSADKYVALPKAELVLCLDVLFHIIDEDAFVGILQNLTRYSSSWIFVYTWAQNPFESLKMRLKLSAMSVSKGRLLDALKRIGDKSSDGLYEKYRDFRRYFSLFEEAGFSLRCQANDSLDKIGTMYIFQKRT